MKLIARFCILCIKTFHPMLLGTTPCLFTPSCSKFVLEQLRTQPFLSAILTSIKRILSCNPFTR